MRFFIIITLILHTHNFIGNVYTQTCTRIDETFVFMKASVLSSCAEKMLHTLCFALPVLLIGCVVHGYQQDQNSLVSVLYNRRIWPEPAIFQRDDVSNSSVLLIDPCGFRIETSDALLKASNKFGGALLRRPLPRSFWGGFRGWGS